MEWSLPVNEMLRDEITKIGHTLLPPDFHGDARSVRLVQDSLSRLIDALGMQSSAAQGLSKVITTAEKLRNSPTHTLYLLKDASAKGGKGELIGMLKVGRKHLFLFDEHDRVCEVEPLCVLDFFVVADRQRRGLGRCLFDHMLQEEGGLRPEQLAIDGPSPKMEQFLKNYGLERLVRQNNNFAVCPQFFTYADKIRRSGADTPATAGAIGRYAAHKPASSIATVIHGDGGSDYYSHSSRLLGADTSSDADVIGRYAAYRRGSSIATMIHGDGGSAYYSHRSRNSSRGATPDVLMPEEPLIPKLEPEPAAATWADSTVERPTTLEVEPVSPPADASLAATRSPASAFALAAPPSPGGRSPRRDSQLTDRGYFDIKFYHNKLW